MEKTETRENLKSEKISYEKPSIEKLGTLSTLIKGASGTRTDFPPYSTSSRP